MINTTARLANRGRLPLEYVIVQGSEPPKSVTLKPGTGAVMLDLAEGDVLMVRAAIPGQAPLFRDPSQPVAMMTGGASGEGAMVTGGAAVPVMGAGSPAEPAAGPDGATTAEPAAAAAGGSGAGSPAPMSEPKAEPTVSSAGGRRGKRDASPE